MCACVSNMAALARFRTRARCRVKSLTCRRLEHLVELVNLSQCFQVLWIFFLLKTTTLLKIQVLLKNVKPEWEIEILFSWTSNFWRAHQHFLTCFYLYKHMLSWVVVISSTQIGILTSALLTGCKWTVWEDLALTELTVVLLTSV